MIYELARQLKDARFPQRYGEMYRWICSDNSRVCVMNVEEYPDACYVPTLSELIEACGDIVLWKSEKWCAGKYSEYCCGDCYFDDYPVPLEYGDTPEEAVAKLWLNINKKL